MTRFWARSCQVALVFVLGCGVVLSVPNAASAEGTQVASNEIKSKKPKLFKASASIATPKPPSFGQVVKACGTRKRDMGKVVGKSPEKGRAQWTLYDSNPAGTTARSFYVTGFSDGCPRRITAAVAMFGSVELYELVNFGDVGLKPEKTNTAKAYAKLRASACGSGKTACKASGLRSMTRSTTFLSAYEQRGGGRELELLVHRGKIAASTLK